MSCHRTTFDAAYYNLLIVLCQDKKEVIFMARIIDGEQMNLIGSRVRELRMERGLSQQTLSARL